VVKDPLEKALSAAQKVDGAAIMVSAAVSGVEPVVLPTGSSQQESSRGAVLWRVEVSPL